MNQLFEFIKNLHFASGIWGLALPMCLIALDVLLGVIGAVSNKTFKSARMRKGLSKKAGEVAILVIGELFSLALHLPPYVMTFFSFYIILMEGTSLVENLGKLGVPLPKFISTAADEMTDAVIGQDVESLVKRIEELEKKEDNKNDDERH